MNIKGSAFVLALLTLTSGCAYETVQPGHQALRFDPHGGGLQHERLLPGQHGMGWCFLRDCGRLDDFDITYSTKHEGLATPSQEGLQMEIKMSVIYRPIAEELYQLDAEIGPNYYEEVVGPELRSVARGVFAHHSYAELLSKNEKIEDEIESDLRRRTHGKHVSVESITIEGVDYAPEIANAVRQKIVGEQESVRQKAALENEALRQRTMLENQAAQQKMKEELEGVAQKRKIEMESESEKRKVELELLQKKNQRQMATEQAAIDKIQATAEAETRVVRAKGQAQEVMILAKAHAEENRAQTQAVSPLTVQLAAYEALGKLGGNGTTILLGDWSRAPQFLFPHAGAFNNMWGGRPPTASAAAVDNETRKAAADLGMDKKPNQTAAIKTSPGL
jgi:regulator of protease activity HflC (stomatin/prohibitin superfamily)